MFDNRLLPSLQSDRHRIPRGHFHASCVAVGGCRVASEWHVSCGDDVWLPA